MRINTKSPKFSECLNYHISRVRVGLLKTDFLACFIRMVGPSMPPSTLMVSECIQCHVLSTIFLSLSFFLSFLSSWD